MVQPKNILRLRLLAERQALSTAICDKQSSQIGLRAFAAIDWSAVRTVCTYQAIEASGEIDTTPLLSLLAQLPHAPRVTTVPAQAAAPFPAGDFTVIIVPVLGFDQHNHRLGRGGGWYDKFLASQPRAITIGLARAASAIAFHHETHDIPLDIIVTETSTHYGTFHN